MGLFTQRQTIALNPQSVEISQPIKTTLQVLEEIKTEQAKSDGHLDRLYALVDEDACFSKERREKLKRFGFCLFVKARWVGCFKYHACIYTPRKIQEAVRTIKDGRVEWYQGDEVRYKGDIPDCILYKALSIKDEVCQISIHSMSPFPIELKHCDPIMIGWVGSPHIQTDLDGSFYKVLRPHVEGVVIGVWDYDKEVEILG